MVIKKGKLVRNRSEMESRFGHDVPAICFVLLVPTPAGQHKVSKGLVMVVLRGTYY